MKNSKYCYCHSVGKFKGVPILKNPTVHLVVGILSIITTIAAFKLGATREKQTMMFNKLDEIEISFQDKISTEKIKQKRLVRDLINKSFFDILTEVIRADFPDGINCHFDMAIKEVATGKTLKEIRFVDIQNNFENYRHVALVVATLDTEIYHFQEIINSGIKNFLA